MPNFSDTGIDVHTFDWVSTYDTETQSKGGDDMRFSRCAKTRRRAALRRRPHARRAGRRRRMGLTSSQPVQSLTSQLGGLGSSVSPEKVEQLAKGVRPEDTKDEQKMRQLIYQVSKSFNVPVDDKTINDIVKTLKTTDINKLGSLIGNFGK